MRSMSVCTMLLAVVFARIAAGQAAAAHIDGIVTDSIHHRPLAGATVIATPASIVRDSVMHVAATDARGRFSFSGLRSGRYTISVEHASIDSTGVGVPPLDVTLAAGDSATAALAIPSSNTLRRIFCPLAARDTSLGVMLGAVRTLDGSPIARATIVFTWGDFDVDRGTAIVTSRQVSASATTDSLGVYRACGLPVSRTLFVQAQAGATEYSGVLEEQIGEVGVLVRDFHVSTSLAATQTSEAATAVADASAPTGHLVVAGRVQSTSGQPIASAQVRLFGTLRTATTDDAGEFRLGGLPAGTQGIEVVALGFYPRRLRVEIGDEMAPMSIKLERAAVVLDSIRVTAKRVNSLNLQQYREFEARAAGGNGFFITEDQIKQQHPIETSDILKLDPAVKVFGFGSEARIASARGRAGIGNNECALDIFIDGVRAQQTDVNTLPPDAIHGIEIHTVASAPVRYGVGTCGALFIWTK
jgi:hypothetical protein